MEEIEMAILDDSIRAQVVEFFQDLAGPVRLVMFTQESNCELCPETRQLVEEIGELSDKITVEVHDYVAGRARADELGIDKVPAIAVIGAEDYGVRLYGIPAGYEFTSFVHAIRSVAAGTTDLGAEVEAELAQVAEPLHLQVFVTPTCPYCPQAVVMAHQMAIASPYIRADMIEATEFPELSMKYQVMGVPRTVINEIVHIEGAAPLGMMMDRIREALQHSGEVAA